MAVQYPNQTNKLIVGSLAITMILIAWLIVPFRLLEALQDPEFSSLYKGLTWTVLFGVMGFTLAWGLDPNVEIRTGKQDLWIGVFYSIVFLGIATLINAIFLHGAEAVNLIGGRTSMTKGDRFLLSYAAAINEELFFRAGLQRIFIKLLPDNPFFWVTGVFMSATIFSLYHKFVYGTQGASPFVYLFLLGATAGLGQLITKRLSVSFLVHVDNNILAFFWGG